MPDGVRFDDYHIFVLIRFGTETERAEKIKKGDK